MSILTWLLIALILLGFGLMTKGILRQEVAMPLVALGAISLAGPVGGLEALQNGALEFARIALLFTAVAVPAHILQRSELLNWVGMAVGQLVGELHTRTKLSAIILVPALGLGMVFLMAALFHNTTSILVGCLILFTICRSYQLPGLPVLAGALVASNLGGFSTRWGDTPNIVEASQWNLTHIDFLKEILPINISALLLLIVVVSMWLWNEMRRQERKTGTLWETTHTKIKFRAARHEMAIDKRLMMIGLTGLVIAIIGPLFFQEYEILFSGAAIAFCVLADYPEHRTETLFALGIETYATLAAIFVLAQVLAHSSIGIGPTIQNWLIQSGMSIWAIASASYIGTLLTEAASWASAASPLVFQQSSSHGAAWALGSGIFAGSSSLVTAASAGIILTQETSKFSDNSRVTFGSYVVFGLSFSLFILIYYIAVLTLLFG